MPTNTFVTRTELVAAILAATGEHLPSNTAFGLLGYSTRTFTWYYNDGFAPVGGAGEPVNNSTGDWDVTILAPGTNPVVLAIRFGEAGQAWQNGPVVNGVANIKIITWKGALVTGDPLIVGDPIPEDGTVLLFAYDTT